MNDSQSKKKIDPKIELLSDLLDSKFEGPFGLRFGLDGLIGLIPGVGDLITSFFSFLIIGVAALKGYPPIILFKMLANVVVDNIISSIPFLGALLDFFWKSNTRNLELMKEFSQNEDLLLTRSKTQLGIFVFLLVFLFMALVYGILSLTLLLFHLIKSMF